MAVLVRTHRITPSSSCSSSPLIPSVILHEVSHGAVALAFGDDTAKRAGRLTLNPVSHIDPFGTIILPGPSCRSAASGPSATPSPCPVNVSRPAQPAQPGRAGVAGRARRVNIVLAAVLRLRLRRRCHRRRQAARCRQRRRADLGPVPLRAGYINICWRRSTSSRCRRSTGRPSSSACFPIEPAARLLPDPALHDVHPAGRLILLIPGALQRVSSTGGPVHGRLRQRWCV